MSGEPLRAVVVGAGAWGRRHASALAAHPRVELRAVAGRTRARTEARAAEFGVGAYVSIAEMLERERPGLVCLSLPNEKHFEATMQVIEAGIPLLAEKPLVFDPAQGRALVDAAAERGLFFAINFNHRFAVPVQLAARAVAEGRIGAPVFATWRFGGEGGGGGHPHANLIETQCHGFDMLEHLAGPIESVAAQMTDDAGRGHETHAVALRFASGAVGSLVGSYASSYAYPGTHQLELNGTEGRLLVQDTVRRFTLSHAGSELSEVWEAGYFNDADRCFGATMDRHLDAVVEALLGGAPPPVDARAGLRALDLAHAVIESHATGTRVAVSPMQSEGARRP